MSLGEADAKFPNQESRYQPPSPSRENPGQVYPKSDPKAAPAESVPGTGGEYEPSSMLGNPFATRSVFNKLDHALGEAVSAIEGEQRSAGGSAGEIAIVEKLKGWRNELTAIRAGQEKPAPVRKDAEGVPQEGGMFTD